MPEACPLEIEAAVIGPEPVALPGCNVRARGRIEAAVIDRGAGGAALVRRAWPVEIEAAVIEREPVAVPWCAVHARCVPAGDRGYGDRAGAVGGALVRSAWPVRRSLRGWR